MGKREGAGTATRKRHVAEAGKIAAARTQQLQTIKQQVQPGRCKTEGELKANLENAEKAGVTWARYIVLDELKYWPHWLARADGTKPKALEELALQITGKTMTPRSFSTDRIVWISAGAGRGSTSCSGKARSALPVCAADGRRRVARGHGCALACLASAEVKSWRVSNVETLRPGDWMEKLADLGGQIRIEQQKRRQKTAG